MSDLHRCSKPSRWRQPPRVTGIPQLNRSPSATRCKLTSKYTWDHSISLWISNQVREMSEREYAQLKRIPRCSKIQDSSPRAGQYIFIDPKTKSRWSHKGVLLDLTGRTGRIDRRSPSVRSLLSKRPDGCHISLFKYRSLDFNCHLASQHAVNARQDALLEMTRLSTTWCPIEYREVLEPEKVDQTRHNVRSLSRCSTRDSVVDVIIPRS
jgi:hypothetical protein